MEPLKSMQNSFIKQLVKLKKRKYREQEGRFVIEGLRFVEEALKSGWPVENIIYCDDFAGSERGADLLDRALKENVKTTPVEKKILYDLASTETPQGVLALCGMKRWRLSDLAGTGRAGRTGSGPLLVVADGVSDPGNLGTIIRSADAFGACGAVLTRVTVDLYNSKTLRATMGSVFHLPVPGNVGPDEIAGHLVNTGISLLVGVPEGGAPLSRMDLRRPLALVVGSEADGPSRELLSLPHEKVSIPMTGRAESLNAGVAASIMLYEIARQANMEVGG
ncbi:MAG: RNA methyltransferase [Firmicutes bacterium]|nr:RNA methyltransferase [Bacillota bacterium]